MKLTFDAQLAEKKRRLAALDTANQQGAQIAQAIMAEVHEGEQRLERMAQEIDDMKQYIDDNHRFWWFSSVKMTIYVVTDTSNNVTDTAAIAKAFIGQPVKNLADWMRGHGGFEYEELKLEAQEVTA